MTTASAGLAFLVALIVALAAVHVPLGDYMYRVYTTDKDNAAERLVYRLIGADPKSEQTWAAYARSVLAFSAVSVLLLFFLLLQLLRRGGALVLRRGRGEQQGRAERAIADPQQGRSLTERADFLRHVRRNAPRFLGWGMYRMNFEQFQMVM